MRNTLLALLLMIAPATAQPTSFATLQIGTHARTYGLSRHATAGVTARLPLIIFLPGLGTRITEPVLPRFDIPFDTLPALGPALIATPQGANRTWDSIPRQITTWRRASGPDGEPIDDIAFLRSLIDHLVATENADPARVYVAGVSAGGYMTLRIACEMSDRVAAVADVIATARAVQLKHCEAARPIPILLLASTTDDTNPYAGQRGGELNAPASAPETVAFFARRNGCTSRTETALPHLADVDSTATLTRHSGCVNDADVDFYRIDGSGHSVPSKTPPEPGAWSSNGARNRDIETAEIVWSFFDRHR